MPFGGAGYLSDELSHVHGAKFWHDAADLCTLSVTYLLWGLALTNTTMENPSEMSAQELTDFVLPVFVP